MTAYNIFNRIHKMKLSAKATISTLMLVSLCACNGGENSSSRSAQSETEKLFKQRNAIILDAIKNGQQVVLPSSLKTFRELRVASVGAYGSNLGMPGYNKMNAMLSHDSCIITNGDLFSDSNYAKGKKSDKYEYTMDSSSKSSEQSQAISASLSGGTSLIQVSGSAAVENSSTFNDSEIGFNLLATVNGTHLLNDSNTSNSGVLKDFFKPIYLTSGSLNSSFYKSCGDGYVNSEDYTAGVKAHISIKLQNQEEASSFRAELSASYGSFAELSASIQAAEKKTSQKAQTIVALSQLGGDSGGLLKVIDSDVLDCGVNNFQSCNAVMNKILTYAGSFADQIKDPTTGNIKPDKVAYLIPSFTKYENKVKLTGTDITPEASAAISRLNKIYLDNLKLYYGFQDIVATLDSSAQNSLKNEVLNKLRDREVYISSQAPLCYNDPSTCATVTLPNIVKQINASYPIDPNVLDFYAKSYTARNFLNLNTKFGSSDNSKAIKVKLLPMSIYTGSDGSVKYNYKATDLGDCSTNTCKDLQVKVQLLGVDSKDKLMRYKITFNNIKSLSYQCGDNRSNGSVDCHGYYGMRAESLPTYNHNDTASFDWFDSLHYTYVGGFTDEELKQIAILSV